MLFTTFWQLPSAYVLIVLFCHHVMTQSIVLDSSHCASPILSSLNLGSASLMELRKMACHPLLVRSLYTDEKLKEMAEKIYSEVSPAAADMCDASVSSLSTLLVVAVYFTRRLLTEARHVSIETTCWTHVFFSVSTSRNRGLLESAIHSLPCHGNHDEDFQKLPAICRAVLPLQKLHVSCLRFPHHFSQCYSKLKDLHVPLDSFIFRIPLIITSTRWKRI